MEGRLPMLRPFWPILHFQAPTAIKNTFWAVTPIAVGTGDMYQNKLPKCGIRNMVLSKTQTVFPSSTWSQRYTHWCCCLQIQRYLRCGLGIGFAFDWSCFYTDRKKKKICSAVGIWLLILHKKGFMCKKFIQKGQVR